ncbi:uncharacterized protein LOC128340029 isoform X1 [Hemicordylus capensis]|uniref:uncharacterized protein LOC128340029 isoform X1 n=1 Tax=Hemicordylus capensis TaxID=884348 RepID=UPI00230449C1|nr:uncharacterized protein LOC128340029 isoform X1 [Hemicordylus capensis]
MGPKKALAKKGGKAPVKKGGKPVRTAKRPNVPVESSDNEGDLELGAIQVLIARLQALEKQRATLEVDEPGGGPSRVPPQPIRASRAAKKAKLMQGFADRLAALEEAAGPATDGAWGSKPLQAGPEPGNGGEDPGDDGSGTGGMEEVRRKCEEAGGYCAIELCHPGDKYIQICHRRRPCCRKVADALQV